MRDRIIENLLEAAVKENGTVLVEGVKGCGKFTTTSKVYKALKRKLKGPKKTSMICFSDIDQFGQWSALRSKPEAYFEKILLTSSKAHPLDKGARIRMRPMSLSESLDSNGEISLRDLFSETELDYYIQNPIGAEELALIVCRGGFPAALKFRGYRQMKPVLAFYDQIIESKLFWKNSNMVDDADEKARAVLSAYARIQGQTVADTVLSKAIEAEGAKLSRHMVPLYINKLKDHFIVEELPPWQPSLRFKKPVAKAYARYFVDPSIAVAALGLRPKHLVKDPDLFEPLFKGMCIRDLRVYAQALGGTVYHYRDLTGLTCDAVLQLKDGRYGLIDIILDEKLSVDESAKKLKKLARSVDRSKMPEPSFLMILTGLFPHAYRRDDGIYIVPIGSLGI